MYVLDLVPLWTERGNPNVAWMTGASTGHVRPGVTVGTQDSQAQVGMEA